MKKSQMSLLIIISIVSVLIFILAMSFLRIRIHKQIDVNDYSKSKECLLNYFNQLYYLIIKHGDIKDYTIFVYKNYTKDEIAKHIYNNLTKISDVCNIDLKYLNVNMTNYTIIIKTRDYTILKRTRLGRLIDIARNIYIRYLYVNKTGLPISYLRNNQVYEEIYSIQGYLFKFKLIDTVTGDELNFWMG